MGVSETGGGTLRRAHAVTPLAALQSEYSIWSRNIEREILAVLAELGIGLVAYSPLGKSFLTGAISASTEIAATDFRAKLPRFTAEARGANQALVDLLTQIGASKGATPAQFALAWLLAQRPWIVPIPGSTKLARTEENLGASDLNKTADDLAAITASAEAIRIEGARYPEAIEKTTGL